MRRTRNLLLATITVAVAAIAPSAVASPLEITTEPASLHCPAVTVSAHGASGGCAVHAVSTSGIVFRTHIFGFESTVSQCTQMEFTARLDEDASGYAVNQAISGCSDAPCFEGDVMGDKIPWQVVGSESAGSEVMQITFCSSEFTGTCAVNVPFRATGSHTFEFGTRINGVPQEMPGIGPVGSRCEVVGHWVTEVVDSGDQSVEVIHL